MKSFNHNGKTYTIKTLMSASGLSYHQVRYRLEKGMSIGDILKGRTPVHHNPKASLKQLAKENGIPYGTLYSRTKAGMSIEEALAFDTEAWRDSLRKHHTEEERKAAHRAANRRSQARKRVRALALMVARDAVHRLVEAETAARRKALQQLRGDIRQRWYQSPEYRTIKEQRAKDSREGYHEERRWIRGALKEMIKECPEGQEQELAEWMLNEVDTDALRVRPVDEFLGEHAGV